MATPYVQEEIDKLFSGNPFIGQKPQAIPKQAYGLGAGAGAGEPAKPAGVEGMTAKDFERQMQMGSGMMGNIGALEAQAEMQPDYAKALRAVPGQHWTNQATRAMSGIGQGMAALNKEALIKTAGDQAKYTRDLMTKPEMMTDQAKQLRNQFSDAPEATTKMDIFKGKLPDWMNWGS